MYLAYVLAIAGNAPLQPTTKWVVEFADTSCVLARRYGAAEDPVDLQIRAPILGSRFEILIIVPQAGHPPTKFNEEGWIEKPDGSRAAPISVGSFTTTAKTYVTRFYLDPDRYSLGQDGERIIVNFDKAHRYDLALPELDKAKAVLNQCLSGLRDEYGVGEKVTGQIVTPAKSKLSITRYFNTGDYPSAAKENGEQGYVGALFWVETDGRVQECKILESSHRKLLDQRTCDVIRARSRFSPALDQRGKPIRSPEYRVIRWIMPG